MCGLIGFSGKTDFNPKYIDINLIWNSLERGEDATGLFSPKNGIVKSLTKGSHYVLYDQNNIIPDDYLIAHVRAGTVGAKTDLANAHPFERGNYILAHNGTLYNHEELLEKYNLDKTSYKVDSDMLTGCINEANDIGTVIKEINGAAALLIHDKRIPTILYAYTNGDRPLWRGHDNLGNMYISSLGETLYFLKLTGVKEFKKDILYTIENGVILSTKKIKNIPYKKPYVYSSPNTSSNNINVYDVWKDCWVRANWTVSYMSNGENIDISKGSYYHCIGLNSDSLRMVNIFYKGKTVSISIAYLNTQDLIFEGNFVKLIDDEYDEYTSAKIGEKGDIFKVNSIWTDGDISCSFLETAKGKLPYSNKSNFKKLTEEERTIINTNNQTNLFDILREANDKNTTSSVKKMITCAIDESKNKNIIPKSNVQIIVNEEELEDFLNTTDNLLEKLNEDIVKGERSELRSQITVLMDLVFNAQNSLLSSNITT